MGLESHLESTVSREVKNLTHHLGEPRGIRNDLAFATGIISLQPNQISGSEKACLDDKGCWNRFVGSPSYFDRSTASSSTNVAARGLTTCST